MSGEKTCRGEGCGHRLNEAGEGGGEPDGGVGADVEDTLKVAGPSRLLG